MDCHQVVRQTTKLIFRVLLSFQTSSHQLNLTSTLVPTVAPTEWSPYSGRIHVYRRPATDAKSRQDTLLIHDTMDHGHSGHHMPMDDMPDMDMPPMCSVSLDQCHKATKASVHRNLSRTLVLTYSARPKLLLYNMAADISAR